MKAIKVGIREFRADLAGFIASNTPVAVTRHGHTVGYFIPTQGPSQDDIHTLEQAGAALDQVLQQHQTEAETLVADFKQQRQRKASLFPPPSLPPLGGGETSPSTPTAVP